MSKKFPSLKRIMHESLFAEAAVSLEDASNLALCAVEDQESAERTLFIYSPDELIASVKENLPYSNALSLHDIGHHIDQSFIKGYIRTASMRKGRMFYDAGCDPDTKIVNGSAADKGYGPITYDLMMMELYPLYLMADRLSITPEAYKIWKHYFYARKDIEKAPLTPRCLSPSFKPNYKQDVKAQRKDIKQAKTDLQPLLYKYRMPRPENSPYLSKMIEAHQKCAETLLNIQNTNLYRKTTLEGINFFISSLAVKKFINSYDDGDD